MSRRIRRSRIATETPSQLPTVPSDAIPRDEVLLHANSARSRSWKPFRQAPFDKLARRAAMHAAQTLKPETLLVERTSSMPCARNLCTLGDRNKTWKEKHHTVVTVAAAE
mmetsp:Transcript_32677/g.87741  ORF Transcript_32677/g.87741 Transcript_32677/m.87741 type:complete len:110 (+) Transcript_32677:490-819(+)